MPYRKILADNLLTFRKLENISQQEMSFRTEISKETISLIERAKTYVRLDILEKIASYTGLTISQLFTEGFVEKYNHQQKLNKIIREKLLYRDPMIVSEIKVLRTGYYFPICPRCDCTMEVEYQSFCDRCGQRLNWNGFLKAKIRK